MDSSDDTKVAFLSVRNTNSELWTEKPSGLEFDSTSRLTRRDQARVSDTPRESVLSQRQLMFNFVLMAVLFSINRGTVTSLVALASSELGPELGGQGVAVLYFFYVITSVFVSVCIVRQTGGRLGILWALLLSCIYPTSFLLAFAQGKDPQKAYIEVLSGSAIGGIGTGFLWTAQGVYFARSAQLYSEATAQGPGQRSVSEQDANTRLGRLFASIYLLSEVLLKAGSSFIAAQGGVRWVFFVYTLVAYTSSGLMWFVKDLPPAYQQQDEDVLQTKEQLLQTWRFFRREPRLWLLYPYNVTFGLISALLNNYINAELWGAAVSEQTIGYAASVSPAVAVVCSCLFSRVAVVLDNKAPIMVLGAVSWVGLSGVLLISPIAFLINLGEGLVCIYAVQGVARAIFEGMNRATFVDFFPDPNDKNAAYAHIVISSGTPAALAFLIFPFFSKTAKSLLCFIFAIFSVIGLYLAFSFHHANVRRIRQTRETEKLQRSYGTAKSSRRSKQLGNDAHSTARDLPRNPNDPSVYLDGAGMEAAESGAQRVSMHFASPSEPAFDLHGTTHDPVRNNSSDEKFVYLPAGMSLGHSISFGDGEWLSNNHIPDAEG
eukprot:g53166.t1